jgi:hypothetical protein
MTVGRQRSGFHNAFPMRDLGVSTGRGAVSRTNHFVDGVGTLQKISTSSDRRPSSGVIAE